MTDALKPPAEQFAEDWLRGRYGAYRGYFAWREIEMGILAGYSKAGERIAELEADSKRLQHLIARMEIPGAIHQFLSLNNWHPDTFNEGFIAAIDRSIKESER